MYNPGSDRSTADALVETDEQLLLAMQDGFQRLETPEVQAGFGRHVLSELTSGKDFDPWYRQVARRAVWTLVPGAITFVIAFGILSFKGVPSMKIQSWEAAHEEAIKQDELSKRVEAYAKIPTLTALSAPGLNSKTPETSFQVPEWYGSSEHPPVALMPLGKFGLFSYITGEGQ